VLDHPLVEDAVEKFIVGREIVIPSNEMDMAAPDSGSIGRGFLIGSQAEITQDPERVALRNPIVDRLEQRVIMTLHRFRRDIPCPARIDPNTLLLRFGEKGTMAIRDDIGMTQVKVGSEPEFGHEEGWQPEIESEKSMKPIRGIEKQTAMQDGIARRNQVRFDDRPDAPFRTIGHPRGCL
jgi:hypothetical protein